MSDTTPAVRVVRVEDLRPGDRITQSGLAYEGATVAAAAHEQTDGRHYWVQVPLTDGRTMDLESWAVSVKILA